MIRYQFHELRKKSGSLPDDVNAMPEGVAYKLGSQGLLDLLVHARKQKLYGSARHFDDQGRVVAEFCFQHGMCPRFELTEYKANSSFTRSIHNDELCMKKDWVKT